MSFAECKRAGQLARMDRYITEMLAKPGSERNPDISAASRAALSAPARRLASREVAERAHPGVRRGPPAAAHEDGADADPGVQEEGAVIRGCGGVRRQCCLSVVSELLVSARAPVAGEREIHW